MTRCSLRVEANVALKLICCSAVVVLAAMALTTGFPTGLSQAMGDTLVPAGGDKEADPSQQSEAKIRVALQQATTMEFHETPLQDVVDYLKDLHKIQVQLDTKPLEDSGVGTDTPVTFSIKGVSLDSGLKLMLKPLELTSIVKDGVLLITTPQAADEIIELRVYDVADLVENEPTAVKDFGSLLESLLKPTSAPAAAPPKPQPAGGKQSQTPTPLVYGVVSGGMGGGGMGGMGGGMLLAPQAPPEKIKIVPFRKLLLVSAPTATQDELSRLLAEIREKSRTGK